MRDPVDSRRRGSAMAETPRCVVMNGGWGWGWGWGEGWGGYILYCTADHEDRWICGERFGRRLVRRT